MIKIVRPGNPTTRPDDPTRRQKEIINDHLIYLLTQSQSNEQCSNIATHGLYFDPIFLSSAATAAGTDEAAAARGSGTTTEGITTTSSSTSIYY